MFIEKKIVKEKCMVKNCYVQKTSWEVVYVLPRSGTSVTKSHVHNPRTSVTKSHVNDPFTIPGLATLKPELGENMRNFK